MKKYLVIGALVAAISGTGLSQVSFADEHAKPKTAASQQKAEAWNKMTKQEKLKVLNDRHEKKIKSSQERWAKLSDDEKISRYESGVERGRKMRAKHAEYKVKCEEALGRKN